ncbi:alanyl-tRNA editing protein [Salisediminibacterium selenitireducens]|uniref:Threonyl/alanyl tRNA synthetase SAD n=1 Tax=Bacillus selenitireducens (strain ATCC 700615 / DSM 15326 / MLS10) TaxID=439292 RepID=D6Y0B7_BACIE|nr:alanine--tRNA ligase-related protein [Salisediminibacterium selenitireducens]ADH98508.1 Threonyl/alanyl tRNA synthetase SAD [[Bacillus] selenitireducens MLS10]
MTVKGYITDPYKTDFDATVTKVAKDEGGTVYLVFDQTWFYPEGGGQPADKGSISGLPVTDVQLEDGEIRHMVERGVEVNVGDTVHCKLDWNRRLDYMQQHHAQHLLSAVLDDQFDAPTVSVHLGSEECAIEVTWDDLTEREVLEAVDQVNTWIRENHLINTTNVTREEADRYPLRKTPAVSGDVRLVIVEGIDYNPCGGTHPLRTGEVQLVHLTGMERARGGLRITYLAGGRAVARLRQFQRITDEASRLLNSPPEGITDTLHKQIDAHQRLDKEMRSLKEQLLEQLFADWLKGAVNTKEAMVPFIKEDFGMKELQKLSAKAVQALPDRPVLFATVSKDDNGDSHLEFVLAAGRDCGVDLKRVEKDVFALIQGKGGGSPKKLQGGGKADLSLEAFKSRVSDILKQDQ